MGASLFRKRPVVIEAVRWTGDNVDELREAFGEPHDEGYLGLEDGDLYLRTLEGKLKASVGDWIIRGVAGEVYPCKPDIFEQTYESAVA